MAFPGEGGRKKIDWLMQGDVSVCEEKKHSITPYKRFTNNQAARRRTHRGTERPPQGIPDTPDGIHITQALP